MIILYSDWKTFREHDSAISKKNSYTKKLIIGRMKTDIFDPFDLSVIIEFLWNFEIPCIINGICEDTAILLSIVLWRNRRWRFSIRDWNQCSSLKPGSHSCGKNYCENIAISVNYLLRSYATDENIVKTKDEIIMFTQPPSNTLFQYAEEFVLKTLCCEDMFNIHNLIYIFIKEIETLIWHSMESYRHFFQSASLRYLIFTATLFN